MLIIWLVCKCVFAWWFLSASLRTQSLEAGDYCKGPPAWAVVGITAYALHSSTNPLYGCLLPQIQTGDLTRDLTSALTLHLSASHCDLSADLLLGSLRKSRQKRNLFELPRLNTSSGHTRQMCERGGDDDLLVCGDCTVYSLFKLTSSYPLTGSKTSKRFCSLSIIIKHSKYSIDWNLL